MLADATSAVPVWLQVTAVVAGIVAAFATVGAAIAAWMSALNSSRAARASQRAAHDATEALALLATPDLSMSVGFDEDTKAVYLVVTNPGEYPAVDVQVEIQPSGGSTRRESRGMLAGGVLDEQREVWRIELPEGKVKPDRRIEGLAGVLVSYSDKYERHRWELTWTCHEDAGPAGPWFTPGRRTIR
jgi:hypothetical protein